MFVNTPAFVLTDGVIPMGFNPWLDGVYSTGMSTTLPSPSLAWPCLRTTGGVAAPTMFFIQWKIKLKFAVLDLENGLQ